MSNRSTRRASAAIFRKETGSSVNSYLIPAEDVALLDQEMPLLAKAVASSRTTITTRLCIACRAPLSTRSAGAYLLATPTTSAPTADSISSFCVGCLSLPAGELEAHPGRVLSKLVGGRAAFRRSVAVVHSPQPLRRKQQWQDLRNRQRQTWQQQRPCTRQQGPRPHAHPVASLEIF